MNKSENNFEVQSRLFEEIKKNITAQYALVDIVSEVLNTSSDSAYRRIRGDKLLSIEETYMLCKHFKISFDSLIVDKNIHQFDYVYNSVDLSVRDAYINYILKLLSRIEKLKTSVNSNIFMSSIDAPFFYFIYYKELTFFKLFTWNRSVYNYEGSFDEFINKIDTPVLVDCFHKITKDFESIPSVDIWSENTIDTTLRTLNYYTDIDSFPNQDLPLLICEQLLGLLNKLQKWTENGYKGDSNVPFQFYFSEMDFENTCALMKCSDSSICLAKLHSVNSLNISDKDFCTDVEQWFNKLTKRSTSLCSSEKERIKFFNSQRKKVQLLMEKIQSNPKE